MWIYLRLSSTLPSLMIRSRRKEKLELCGQLARITNFTNDASIKLILSDIDYKEYVIRNANCPNHLTRELHKFILIHTCDLPELDSNTENYLPGWTAMWQRDVPSRLNILSQNVHSYESSAGGSRCWMSEDPLLTREVEVSWFEFELATNESMRCLTSEELSALGDLHSTCSFRICSFRATLVENFSPQLQHL